MGEETNWRKLLAVAAGSHGETVEQLTISIDEGGLDLEFNDGFGGQEGVPFTAWSDNWVYFPIQYDGSEWVGSAPRNPCDIKMLHQGGG